VLIEGLPEMIAESKIARKFYLGDDFKF
jgi:ABC-type lipopolysaccharide export system ATPase subunit